MTSSQANAPLPESLARDATSRFEGYEEKAAAAAIEPRRLADLPGDASRVFACSEFVAKTVTRHPDLLEDLIESGDLGREAGADPATEAACRYRGLARRVVADATDDASLMRGLRALKRREQVRIAWRDIGGMADLEATVADTSGLADGIVDSTLDRVHGWETERFGEPTDADGLGQRLAVLGLGKLGAGELNFSSDIDLIFTFASHGETVGGRRSIDNEAFFKRLGQRLIKVLKEVTEDGYVFRVDMRLRPFGASGPLVMSFGAMEDYYATHGRDWERYAFVRARPIAGDRAGADGLLKRLEPFVYRRYFDFGALESMRDMKRLIADEVERKGLESNVKLGPGGIREIEFTGQAFQMVRGGRVTALRGRRILEVIETLGRLGHLPEHAVVDLTDAYRFLRTTEHRLQEREDRQTHVLPTDPGQRLQLAAGMGFIDWESFEVVLNRHRGKVSSHFDQILGPPEASEEGAPDPLASVWSGGADEAEAAALLTAAGYADGAEVRDHLSRFRQSHSVRLMDERAASRLARLMPDLLRASAGTPGQAGRSARETLDRVLRVIEAVARRSVYLALLCERPLALSQLVRLCAASPWIAREVARYPAMLDELLDPRTLYAPLDRAALEADLSTRLATVDAGDTELEMETLRQFKHANVLRVAAADVGKTMPLMVVSDHLTEIAETAVRQSVTLAWRDLVARHGTPTQRIGDEEVAVPFAVIAYGKLGGIELGYSSDLDLVFVHGGSSGPHTTSGERPVDFTTFFARLGQRVIHLMDTRTASGVLYEIDARLRPNGAKGLLVVSIDGLGQYLRDDAWTWEHQALVRARPISGPSWLRGRIAALRREILLVERDPEELRQSVREMREKMRRQLGSSDSGAFDLKQDPGGIADIEFMVQYETLRSSTRLGDYLEFTDNIRLLEGFDKAGVLDRPDVALLTGAYRTYRARVHELALQEVDGIVDESEFRELRAEVMALWDRLMAA